MTYKSHLFRCKNDLLHSNTNWGRSNIRHRSAVHNEKDSYCLSPKYVRVGQAAMGSRQMKRCVWTQRRGCERKKRTEQRQQVPI